MSRRMEQVNELVAQVVCEIVLSELSDPAISALVTITGAKVSPDLRHAKIFFSVLGNDEEWEIIAKALNKAAGFIQRIMAQRIVLKLTPKLTFIPDHTIEHAQKIEGILDNITDVDE